MSSRARPSVRGASERLREASPWLLLAALLGLLALLAVLQQRWLDRVAEADAERSRTAYRAAASTVARDFDAELVRPVLELPPALWRAQRRADVGDLQTIPGALATGIVNWRQLASYPDLLAEVSLVVPSADPDADSSGSGSSVTDDNGEAPQIAVHRLEPSPAELEDPATARFVPAEPSEPLRRVVARFAAGEPTPLADELPGLVLPLPHLAGPGPARGLAERRTRNRSLIARGGRAAPYFLVLRFDDTVLRQRMLPELVERAFGTEPAVRIRIVDREPSRLLFATGPSVPDTATVDLEVELFGPLALGRRGDAVSRRLHGLLALRGVSQAPWLNGSGRQGAGRQEAKSQDLGESPGRQEAGQQEPGRRGRWWDRAAQGPRDSGRLPNHYGQWRLEILHPAGSLAAAVARARQRNTLVGVGVLLLLATSAALLTAAAARSRRLARRQLDFVAAVTHELLTPLAALRSAGQNLAAGIVADADHVARYGATIDHEAERLSTTVRRVLAFAGTAGGRRRWHPRAVDPAAAVGAVLDSMRPMLEAADARIERDLPADLPAVAVDPEALDLALRNLLGNALKYGRGEDGRLTLGVGAWAVGRRVAISVADDGPGVDPRDRRDLFEPFTRGRRRAASAVAGSGLGLALVDGVARAHGGRIRLADAASLGRRGAAFVLELPIADPGDPTS
ncbi:MAG: HAMP domain-containing sensor histidine kinase [Acidobacteriota bacterium]